MTTPSIDYVPSDAQTVLAEPDTLAGVLAQHGMDPAHDSRFHMLRSRPVRADSVAGIVHAGLGLTMALVAASVSGGSALSWAIALVVGLAAMWASLRLHSDEAGAPVVEITLAVVVASVLALLSGEGAARLEGVALTPIAAISAFIAAGGSLLVASALLVESANLRLQARIAAPVIALAATLAVV
jgi:hypothetical protein